jgi:hypothetical protein
MFSVEIWCAATPEENASCIEMKKFRRRDLEKAWLEGAFVPAAIDARPEEILTASGAWVNT